MSMKILKFAALTFIALPSVAAEVPTAEITYISPWTTHVDIMTDTAYYDPENVVLVLSIVLT